MVGWMDGWIVRGRGDRRVGCVAAEDEGLNSEEEYMLNAQGDERMYAITVWCRKANLCLETRRKGRDERGVSG